MLGSLLLAAAFAAAPLSASGTLIAVLPKDRDAYWQLQNGKIHAPRYPRRSIDSRTSGCAAVAFVIESDGSVSRAWPVVETARSGFGRAAVRSVKQWHFTPGPKNPARKPIYTYEAISFYVTDSTIPVRKDTEETIRGACKLKGLPVKESAVQAVPAAQ